MKLLKAFTYIAAFTVLLVACKKDKDTTADPAPSNGPLITMKFETTSGGVQVVTGQLAYVNPAGNNYSVNSMKYYISNVTLVDDSGAEINAGNYNLVDISDPTTHQFTLDQFPVGNYTQLKFMMGVDSSKNYAGAQTGDLDPVNGMFWDWSSGYIFFKHEGSFVDTTGFQEGVYYHYGTQKGLVNVTLPLDIELTKNDAHKVILNFDLDKVYSSPNMIDFNGNFIHQSNGPNDSLWLIQMKENFESSFAIDHIE